jgi:hypothetical protein
MSRKTGVTPKNRALRTFARQDWTAVAIELAVVVAGILIALAVDQWADRRGERQLEGVYLARLHDELQTEYSIATAAEGWARARLEGVEKLADLTADPERAARSPNGVPWAIETASWRSFPRVSAFVYNELQDTGQMRLISSFELRRRLADHYDQLASVARVGEDRSAEERFDAATAGLLSLDELLTIERNQGERRLLATEPTRAVALARAFAGRPEAVREIASVGQHHMYNLRVIGEMKARIRVLDTLVRREQRRRGD